MIYIKFLLQALLFGSVMGGAFGIVLSVTQIIYEIIKPTIGEVALPVSVVFVVATIAYLAYRISHMRTDERA